MTPNTVCSYEQDNPVMLSYGTLSSVARHSKNPETQYQQIHLLVK